MRDFVHRLRSRTGLFEPTAVVLAVLVITSLVFFRVALLPEFGGELGMTTFQLGAVTTVFAVGRLVADLPGGHLADRFPAAGIMAVTAAGVAGASALLGSATAVAVVFAASFLLGVASATTNAAGMTYFSHAGGSQYRGTAMAVFSAALLGGQALGPAVAGLVAGAVGWRAAMVTGAVAAALIALFLAAGRGRPVAGEAPGDPRGTSRPGAGPRPRAMLVLQSVSFAVFLTLGAVPQTLVPVIGAAELGLGAAAIGLALGLGGLSRLVGTIVGGRLSDRLSRKGALVPGLIGQALGVGLLAFPPSLGSWVGAIVVMSLASFAVPVAATVLGDLSDPGGVGVQLGRFRFVGDIGLVVGPVTVTALYDWYGRELALGTVVALLLVVAVLVWRVLPETRPAAG